MGSQSMKRLKEKSATDCLETAGIYEIHGRTETLEEKQGLTRGTDEEGNYASTQRKKRLTLAKVNKNP